MKSFSISQAAIRLNVGIQRVYSLVYSKKLAAIKTPQGWRINEAAIRERQKFVAKYQSFVGVKSL